MALADDLLLLFRSSPSYSLFHDAMHEPYCRISIGTRTDVLPIRSRRFHEWLSYISLRAFGTVPSEDALGRVCNVLAARALHESPREDVHIRVAEADGRIYLDLADDARRVVEISRDGWKVVSVCPVYFLRLEGALPLPVPERGGSLESLSMFRLEDEYFRLLRGFLLGCLRESIPFPALIIMGPQGSGKSLLCRVMKGVVDPSVAPIRALPTDERDLVISAKYQHVLCFDNVSHLTEELSDSICRLTSGAGLATRTLYSNDDLTVFQGRRPIVLNGISEFVTRGDLIDRSILIRTEPFSNGIYRPEQELIASFELEHARILGALCDAAASALADFEPGDDLKVRLADWASFVRSGEMALGMERGQFIAAFESNREDFASDALSVSAVGQGVIALMEGKDVWTGTAGELLEALSALVSGDVRRGKEWPHSPRGMSSALRRIAPWLAAAGLHVQVGVRQGHERKRLIYISRGRFGKQPSAPSAERQDEENKDTYLRTIQENEPSANRPQTVRKPDADDTKNEPSADRPQANAAQDIENEDVIVNADDADDADGLFAKLGGDDFEL